jgi:hypothetical protein
LKKPATVFLLSITALKIQTSVLCPEIVLEDPVPEPETSHSNQDCILVRAIGQCRESVDRERSSSVSASALLYDCSVELVGIIETEGRRRRARRDKIAKSRVLPILRAQYWLDEFDSLSPNEVIHQAFALRLREPARADPKMSGCKQMPDERTLLCLAGRGHTTIRRLILCANGIGNPEEQNS